jgi:hypothetical protein
MEVKSEIPSRACRDRLGVNEETFLAFQSVANEELGLGFMRFALEVENPVIAKPGYRIHPRRCGALERLNSFQKFDSGRQIIEDYSSVITLGLEPPRNLGVANALQVPVGIVDAYAVMDIGYGSDWRDRWLNRLRSGYLCRAGWANAND